MFCRSVRKGIQIDTPSVNDRDLRSLNAQTFLVDNLAFCLDITDTELFWLHGQGDDISVSVAGSPGVHCSVQSSYDDDVSFGGDPGSRFHIAKDDDAGIRLQDLSFF